MMRGNGTSAVLSLGEKYEVLCDLLNGPSILKEILIVTFALGNDDDELHIENLKY